MRKTRVVIGRWIGRGIPSASARCFSLPGYGLCETEPLIDSTRFPARLGFFHRPCPHNRSNEEDGYSNITLNGRADYNPLENVQIQGSLRYVDANVEFDDFGAETLPGTDIIIASDADQESDTTNLSGRVQGTLTLLDGKWDHRVGFSGLKTTNDSFTDGEKTFFFNGNKTIIDYQSNLFLKTPNFASGTHDLTFLIEHQNQGGENTDGEDPEGNELVRRPKHIASATFNYAFLPNAEGRDRANLNLDIRYNGEQQDNIYLAPFFERQRTTLDSDTLVTLAGSYDLDQGLKLFAPHRKPAGRAIRGGLQLPRPRDRRLRRRALVLLGRS